MVGRGGQDGLGGQDGRIKTPHPAYNFILHTAPCRSEELASYHWHLEILPRTARLAGFEWGSGVHIVATPPEEAAARLAGVAISAAP